MTGAMTTISQPSHVRAAVAAMPHVPKGKRKAVRRHIMAKAAQVGGSQHIPSSWQKSGAVVKPMALSNRDAGGLDLGVGGAEWKHGWIPVNAAAVKIAAERKRAGLAPGGEAPSTPTSKQAADISRGAKDASRDARRTGSINDHLTASSSHAKAADEADRNGFAELAAKHRKASRAHRDVAATKQEKLIKGTR